VAGRVEEGDRLVAVMDLVGADVLGDSTGLPRHHLRFPDRVEQRRLAVIDMAHHRNHRRPLLEVSLGVLEGGLLGLLFGGGDDLDLAVEFVGDRPHGLVAERLRQRRHLPHRHQLLDHLGASEAEQLPDLAYGGTGRDLDRLRLDDLRRASRRLLQKRSAAASSAAPGRPGRRCLAHVVAP